MLSGDDCRTTDVWMKATLGATRWKSCTTLCSPPLSCDSALDDWLFPSPRSASCSRDTSSPFSRQSRKSMPRSLRSRFNSDVVKSDIDRLRPARRSNVARRSDGAPWMPRERSATEFVIACVVTRSDLKGVLNLIMYVSLSVVEFLLLLLPPAPRENAREKQV